MGMKLPQLRGMDVKGRTAVLFSREDLSTGMVGESVGGVLGYAPKSATAIVQHLLCSTAPAKAAEPKAAAEPKVDAKAGENAGLASAERGRAVEK
jgi:hypothetical protein